MSARTTFSVANRIANIVGELDAVGMRIEVGDDFAAYRRHRNSLADRSPIYPMFDVGSSYIDESNGFWICGFDESGTVIHTQAIRLLALNGTLDEHLSAHRHKYITPYTTPDPDMTFFTGPRSLPRITGTVCYHGDFWLPSRGLGGPRSQGATSLLSRLMFELMWHSWKPQYVFALVPKRLAAKGAHLRYGYSHCEPGRWIGPDQQITDEDYLIWMSSEDIADALCVPPSTLRSAEIVPATQMVTPIKSQG